jgi:hypothetical protein
MYGLAEAGVGPGGGAGHAGSERHVDVDVTVTIPAWSQVNEDKRVAALVESVWLGWGQAVVTLIKMAIGISACACLLWVGWSSSWGAYHPVVILAAWGTAIYWVFSMTPLIIPLPTPPAPHGPFTMVAKPPPGCEVKVVLPSPAPHGCFGGVNGKLATPQAQLWQSRASKTVYPHDAHTNNRCGTMHSRLSGCT